MKKNIVFVVSSLKGGGAERVVSVWASALADRGYNVTLMLFHRADNEYPLSPDVNVVALADTEKQYKALSPWKQFREIRSVFRNNGHCTAISFLPSPQVWTMIAAVGLPVRRIDTIRINPSVISIGQYTLPALSWRLSFATSDAIIVQADGQKEWFSKKCRKKAVLIPNPISKIYETSYKQDTPEDVREFVAAGRISDQKNYLMMVEGFAGAAKRHPGIRLRIYGAGGKDYERQITDSIAQHNMQDRIILMGRSERMNETYKEDDVFLMTSNHEGLPNSLMEAMASRLVCISTDCQTGPRDLIDNGENGILIPVGDAAALTDAICRVMEMSQEQRTQMADAAREKIMTYCSTEGTTDKLCELIASL